MNQTTKDKIELLIAYAAARAAEPSTWRGVVVLLTMCGSRYAELDWGMCASFGIGLSAFFKIVSPDTWTKVQALLKDPS